MEELTESDKNIIHRNEQEIKQLQEQVNKMKESIDALKKQNRAIIGRD